MTPRPRITVTQLERAVLPTTTDTAADSGDATSTRKLRRPSKPLALGSARPSSVRTLSAGWGTRAEAAAANAGGAGGSVVGQGDTPGTRPDSGGWSQYVKVSHNSVVVRVVRGVTPLVWCVLRWTQRQKGWCVAWCGVV